MQINNYLADKIKFNHQKNKILNVTPGVLPLLIDSISQQQNRSVLVITTDPTMVSSLEREIPFYNPQISFLPFPDWETLPYDNFSPNDEIISDRVKTLSKLDLGSKAVTCISLPTALHRLCPREFIAQNCFNLKCNEQLNLTSLRTKLIEYGYSYVTEVSSHGQFTIKGSIVDIYPMGSELPYRIDLFDDEIDSIRTFDPETQRSIVKLQEINLLPANEFPFTTDAIKKFRTNWREQFQNSNPLDSHIYEDVSNQVIPNGIEYYIPLFFDKMHSIFNYVDQESIVILVNSSNENINNQIEKFLNTVNKRYLNYNVDRNNPLLNPKHLFLASDEFFASLSSLKLVEIDLATKSSDSVTKDWHQSLNLQPIPDIAIDRNLKDPLAKLRSHINTHPDFKYLICAESKGRLDTIWNLFKNYDLRSDILNSDDNNADHNLWYKFLNSTTRYNLGIGNIDHGFVFEKGKFIVISESDLYGNVVEQRRLRKRKDLNTENIIKNLAELKPGQLVVHQEHGIGRYIGLETIALNNVANEYLSLIYDGNSKLFVPVTSLQLISRYSGLNEDEDTVQLHKLGSRNWSQAKQKALEKIKDTAAELLAIYAKRAAHTGFSYQINQQEYEKFCASFKFEETPDQLMAIKQVLGDMQSNMTMDRLICGDVGFGKTEVALRAAFIASTNNKQVAILVPTTLLAQQHYQNFKDRFADFPINIELLSRFRSSKETKATLDHISAGKVDIVVGTHKLLQASVKFKDLGLLIIDEEHRFGVGQKEQIKKLRSNVDILTMTATPIPRTLNLSLTGIRDLSLITTPPQKRLAIKTFLQQRNPDLIIEAISREISRGGQVYFLHNNIKTINQVHNEVAQLFPEIRVAVAHGQMPERELEKIMSDFYHRRFHILICTTIIETGIDVPSANTIIIDRADKLGLAQLHQLRGRVGRSHHQAYAYLFTPKDVKISSDAEKRLEAISNLENLGAGFTLASQDMEIRGTGNLLGEEQSGHIEAIGYNLYIDLLNNAIKALKAGKIIDITQIEQKSCEVDLKESALFPDDFIHDVNQRLVLYKRLASATSSDDLESLKNELADRFGKLPTAVSNLFMANLIKIKAEKLKIIKIDIGSSSGKIKFDQDPNINHKELINLIQTKSSNYKLASNDILSFYFPMTNITEKYDRINLILDKIALPS